MGSFQITLNHKHKQSTATHRYTLNIHTAARGGGGGIASPQTLVAQDGYQL